MHVSFSLISEAYLKVFGCSLMMNSRCAVGLQEMNVVPQNNRTWNLFLKSYARPTLVAPWSRQKIAYSIRNVEIGTYYLYVRHRTEPWDPFGTNIYKLSFASPLSHSLGEKMVGKSKKRLFFSALLIPDRVSETDYSYS